MKEELYKYAVKYGMKKTRGELLKKTSSQRNNSKEVITITGNEDFRINVFHENFEKFQIFFVCIVHLFKILY